MNAGTAKLKFDDKKLCFFTQKFKNNFKKQNKIKHKIKI